MSIYRSLSSLLTSYGLLLIANGLFSTIIAIRTKTEAFSDSTIGMVLACYFIGMLLSSLYAANMVSIIGHIRTFATLGTLASMVVLAHLLWVDAFFWGGLRLVSGFCMGGMIVVTEGWLNERASNQNRGHILSLYMITTYACAGTAQFALMLGNPEEFRLFIIVSVIFSLALIPLLITRSASPAQTKPHRPNIKKLYQTSPVGMLGTFTVGYINGVFYAMTPVFAYSIGLDLEETAIFIALSIMSGMLLQFPLGKLSDKIDRRWVIVFSALMTSVACAVLFAIDGSNNTLLYLAGVFYGSVAFSINPICVAHTNDLAPSTERTQTSSGLLMFYGIGAIMGPITAGLVVSSNIHNIYLLSGTATFLFSVYTIVRLKIKPRHLQKKPKFKPFSGQSPARNLSYTEEDNEAFEDIPKKISENDEKLN